VSAWRRNRFARLQIAAAALVAAVVVVLVLTRVDSGGSATTASNATVVSVDLDARGPRVASGFLGLSLEYPAVQAYAGSDPLALDPVFEQLVRNLAPGQKPILRIGGDSADATWWPVPGVPRPPGVTFALTDRWLAVTRALARALSARLILGINLEADNPELGAAEASALLHGIGAARIRALELGNEPDLYADFAWYHTAAGKAVPGRPPNYDMAAFIDDFTAFAGALPHLPLAGPSLGGPRWTRELGRFLVSEPRVGLVTLHRYPLQRCFTRRGSSRYPTVANLLAPAASTGLADFFAPAIVTARARGLPVRIDELNSVACGASPKVSETFASALWALDTLFEMARVGAHGVNIHTFPGAGYQLFKITRSGGRWRAAVAPEYYGLLMFASAAPPGSRLLRITPASSAGGTVKVWATRATDGTIRVVLINKGARPALMAIRLAGPTRRATLERLTAPSLLARSGVMLGGRSLGSPTSTGLLSGRRLSSSVDPVAGRYAVRVPAASAAMLVIGAA
jgi:hypothetical protein